MSHNYFGQTPSFGDFPFAVINGTGIQTYDLGFTCSNENGLLVFINGAPQRPGTDYNAGGTTIVFSENLTVGQIALVFGMGLPKSSLAPSAGSVGDAEVAAGLKANPADVTALTATDKFVTPASLTGLPLTKEYESAEQSIVASSGYTLAHGMGKKPKLYQAVLVCKTAEAGYVVGDELSIACAVDGSDSAANVRGLSVVGDATNISVRLVGNAITFTLINKTTAAVANITPANWRLVLRAWA